MVKKKNNGKRTTLSSRFKKNPITTTVSEAKKLGVPKPVSKLILLGTIASFMMPQTAPFLNRIPGMSVFTGAGASLRQRLLSMR